MTDTDIDEDAKALDRAAKAPRIRAAMLAALTCIGCTVTADCPVACDAARLVVKDHCDDVVVASCDDDRITLECAPGASCLVDRCYDTLGASIEDVGGCP